MYFQATLQTKKPGLYDITGEVQQAVAQSNIASGVCAIVCHNPAGGVLLASRQDPLTLEDIAQDIERLFPPRTNYLWGVPAQTAAAHSAAALAGSPVDCIIQNNQLLLEKCQGIFLLDPAGGQPLEYSVTCV